MEKTKEAKKDVSKKKDAAVLSDTDRFAIFQSGKRQFHAVEGKTIAIEKIEGGPGDVVEFKEVLLRKLSEKDIQIGQPYLDGPVKASIVKQMKAPKIYSFRFIRRQKVRVKKGHRQPLTVVRIESI